MKWIERNWRKFAADLPEQDEKPPLLQSVTQALLRLLRAPWPPQEVVLPPKILVESNFEIVFLTPAPLAEAELARFAERIGNRVGTLFKITKESILSSIAKGMTCEEMIATLAASATAPVPQNVVHEVEGWASQCRRVGARAALLIECPDAETSALVQSIGGKHVQRLSDITLEILDPKMKGTLLRKLRKDGIFE